MDTNKGHNNHVSCVHTSQSHANTHTNHVHLNREEPGNQKEKDEDNGGDWGEEKRVTRNGA